MSNVYPFCTRFFHSKPIRSTKPEDYHQPQRRGSCTQKCVQAWMHHEIPYPAYRQFKFRMTENTHKKLEKSGKMTEGVDKRMVEEVWKKVLARETKAQKTK